jgi:hypothetical protein
MTWNFVSAYWKRRIEAAKIRRAPFIDLQRLAEGARNERQKEADSQKIIAALQRINNSQQAYAQQRNTDNERVAIRERRRFWLDVAGVWVNVAGITVALAAAGFLLWQQHTMQGQLDVMGEDFTATERPWVSNDAKPVSGPLVFLPNGDISLSLHFQFRNSGRTPAIFAAPDITIVLSTTGSIYQIITKVRAYCENSRLAKFSLTESGVLVPPGRSISYPAYNGVIIKRDYINAARNVSRGKDIILPYIGGCINYQFTFGERRRHQTGFIYQLIGPDTSIDLNGGDIPSDKLELIEQDGSWAD